MFLLYVPEVEPSRRGYPVGLMELITKREENLNGEISGVLDSEFLTNIENSEEVDVGSGDLFILF